jgi:hypothetical protein
MKKTLILITIFASLLTQNANALCIKSYEKVFFDLKALQSSMMVAALSCNLTPEYNSFMKKYSRLLNESGSRVKKYFIKAHGNEKYKSHLNRFSTKLANSSTTVSMHQAPDAYCNLSKYYLQSLVNTPDKDAIYRVLGINSYENIHKMNICY